MPRAVASGGPATSLTPEASSTARPTTGDAAPPPTMASSLSGWIDRSSSRTDATPAATDRTGVGEKPGRFNLTVEIPPNTSAEVWVPTVYKKERAPERAKLVRTEDGYTVYRVGSGLYSFTSTGQAAGS